MNIIPYYTNIFNNYNLTITQTLIYGCIKELTVSSETQEILINHRYFANIFKCSIGSISRNMKDLALKGLISFKSSHKTGLNTIKLLI
jgi:hypothetical protein